MPCNCSHLYLCLVAILLSISTTTQAQSFELGVQVGTANYLGDLTPSNLWVSLGETNLSTGLIGRFHASRWISIQAGIRHGTISATDANALETQGRRRRNLHFRTAITEIALISEFHLLGYRAAMDNWRLSPYAFIGIAWYHFNPKAKLGDTWYELQPLGTEGQGLPGRPDKYRLNQWSVPLGLGLRYALNRRWTISLEWGMRKTYTDYLDDTSSVYPDLEALAELRGEIAAQLSWRTRELNPEALPPSPGAERGDADDLDWYIFSGITISRSIQAPQQKKNRGRVKCPGF
ncbi:MAG: DUF6089 family protein [Bacteroidota bacterium]